MGFAMKFLERVKAKSAVNSSKSGLSAPSKFVKVPRSSC